MLKNLCPEARRDLTEMIADLPLEQAQAWMAAADDAPVDADGEIDWLKVGDRVASKLGKPKNEYPSVLLAAHLDRWLAVHGKAAASLEAEGDARRAT